ncbi:LysR substrate-binding domain-containing protein [Stigmatella sp. ncwal1]|uniref:LysR substrate-binding domain-containing protein n=1 Tax=Stigmatella ashevillensis TaxID=2995309 RepID=A0ABT5DAE7_9BACT|nr:LysR family transcriptional regulator [Stigmatella ashevillena]MDC0710624.1 LysR substrate-binding domain-containing protein [Stigmatella ashevillena]
MDLWPSLQSFLQSVRAGSFSAAARDAGTTPSAFSKKVARLEAHLGVRLLLRGAKGLELTPEGQELFQRVDRAFEDVEDACMQVTRATEPRGLVRVSAAMDTGRDWLIPRIARFARAHPHVALEVSLSDRFVDLLAERFDVALRVGEFDDGRLMRRRLGRMRRCFCASPAYLRARGVPRRHEELAGHVKLAYLRGTQRDPWELPSGGRIHPEGPFASDNNAGLLQLVRAGLGVAWLPELTIAEDVQRGTLKVLVEHPPDPGMPISLAFPQGRLLAPRVRAFLDFFAEEARTSLHPSSPAAPSPRERR